MRTLTIEQLEDRELLSGISGTVREDITGAGPSSDDTPLAGWTIRLFQDDGDGQFDPAFDAMIATQPTGADGSYQFSGLADGKYFVQQAVPDGWFVTSPAQPAPIADGIVIGPPASSTPVPNTPGAPLLPDLTIDVTTQNSGINEWFIRDNHLYFGQATPNIGVGPLELRGGAAQPDGTQIVYQRIYDNRGGYSDSIAGYFVYHPTHHHTHFTDFAQYNLRAALPDSNGDGIPEVGDVVVAGEKTSFCLSNVISYDDTLANYVRNPQDYGCESFQRIDVGWEDIYDAYTPGQEIDITNVSPGNYWLEEIVDPLNRIQESNESNNVARRLLNISSSGPGGVHTVQLAGGASLTGRDFSDFHLVTVSGHVFEDQNGNGINDSSQDSGLPNRVVFLDENGDGILNNPQDGPNHCSPLASEPCTVTDATGNYSIPGVEPGEHVLRTVVQPAEHRSLPADEDHYHVNAVSGTDAPGRDFALDLSPPTVQDFQWLRNEQGITALELTFSEPLDPITAQNLKNYKLFLEKTGLTRGSSSPDAQKIRLQSAVYDAALMTVRLTPRKPLILDRQFRITVRGALGVTDRLGNALDGNGDGVGGDPYDLVFAGATSGTLAQVAERSAEHQLAGGSSVPAVDAWLESDDRRSEPRHGRRSWFEKD